MNGCDFGCGNRFAARAGALPTTASMIGGMAGQIVRRENLITVEEVVKIADRGWRRTARQDDALPVGRRIFLSLRHPQSDGTAQDDRYDCQEPVSGTLVAGGTLRHEILYNRQDEAAGEEGIDVRALVVEDDKDLESPAGRQPWRMPASPSMRRPTARKAISSATPSPTIS